MKTLPRRAQHLTLNRETLRTLNATALDEVVGGSAEPNLLTVAGHVCGRTATCIGAGSLTATNTNGQAM